jgi:hypothetical protein
MSGSSDRFKIVPVASAAPGVCRVCGGASKDWYIDFGYNEEFYGAVYYCCQCIEEMAHTAGFLTPALKAQLENNLKELQSENFALKVRTDGLEKALDGLHSAGFLVSRDPDWVGFGVPEAASDRTDSESTPRDSLGAREGEAPEPSDEQGVADLRSSGGVEEPESEFRLSI